MQPHSIALPSFFSSSDAFSHISSREFRDCFRGADKAKDTVSI